MSERRRPEKKLVGVFEDQESAAAAADAVAAQGVDPGQVRVGDEADEVSSLRGEMREEMEHTVAGPGNVGPFTKEMTKGLVPGTALAALAGALVALPFALIPMGSLPLVTRVLIVVAVGTVAGATLGFVLGAAFGAKGPREPLATERGVTVSVSTQDRDQVQRAAGTLEGRAPTRLDEAVEGGQPTETVTTEEESQA